MNDTVTRFSGRAENYHKFRPRYPREIIKALAERCDLKQQSKIADIGSGTGILSELFLENGNQVFCIEPNPEMRAVAEPRLASHPGFVSVNGTAEKTGLPDESIDLIAAGQAFHWFDREPTRREWLRIMKPDGWVALIWNERQLVASPFLEEYEAFLLSKGTDYQQVRHENTQETIDLFFAPEQFTVATFPNFQDFDLEGLTGRVLSTSYVPRAGQPGYEEMLVELRRIFADHAQAGKVTINYDTKIYYGRRGALQRD